MSTFLEIKGRKVSVSTLFVPLVSPGSGTHCLVGPEKLLAWSKILALRLHAAEVVDIVLETAVCLVLVGKSGVVAESVKFAAEVFVRHCRDVYAFRLSCAGVSLIRDDNVTLLSKSANDCSTNAINGEFLRHLDLRSLACTQLVYKTVSNINSSRFALKRELLQGSQTSSITSLSKCTQIFMQMKRLSKICL